MTSFPTDRCEHLRVRGEQRGRYQIRLEAALWGLEAHHLLRLHLGRAHSGKRQRRQQQQRQLVKSGVAVENSPGAERNKVGDYLTKPNLT